MATTVYLDACCVSRPFDDQRQVRVRFEAEAVLFILARVCANEWAWVASEALDQEISENPNADTRGPALTLLRHAQRWVAVGSAEVARACTLQGSGLGGYDALHVACAEAGGVDVLLTTDDRLVRAAGRLKAGIRVTIANPLDWLRKTVQQ